MRVLHNAAQVLAADRHTFFFLSRHGNNKICQSRAVSGLNGSQVDAGVLACVQHELHLGMVAVVYMAVCFQTRDTRLYNYMDDLLKERCFAISKP